MCKAFKGTPFLQKAAVSYIYKEGGRGEGVQPAIKKLCSKFGIFWRAFANIMVITFDSTPLHAGGLQKPCIT